MVKSTFDEILDDFKSGKITVQEAVSSTAVGIQNNKALFKLEHYDDDFVSEIVLKFLTRGSSIFEKFDENYGSFVNYLIANVTGYLKSEKKKLASEVLTKRACQLQLEDNYNEYEGNADFTLIIDKKFSAPYAWKKPEKEEFRQTVKEFMTRKRTKNASKAIIIISLKSCFYLTDDIIDRICTSLQLDKDNFYEVVQELKNDLDKRFYSRKKIIERRNNAFFCHRKYNAKLAADKITSDYLQDMFEKKYRRSTERWQNINYLLSKGKFCLKPTDKKLAQVLGICERQIRYYMKFIEELKETENLKELNSELV